MSNQRVGIFIGDTDEALQTGLRLSQVEERLKADSSLYLAHIDDPFGQQGQQKLSQLCEQEQLVAAVVCGAQEPSVTERPLQVEGDSTVTIPLFQTNLRERCAWIHPDIDQASEKAERILRIAVARARQARPIALSTRPVNRRIVVLGGNHAAYQTALSLASADLDVLLLKTDTPEGCFFPLPTALVEAAEKNERITISEKTPLRAINGQLGDFHIVVEDNGKAKGYQAGAVVIAIDARIEDDTKLAVPHETLRSLMDSTHNGSAKTDTVGILLDLQGPERRCAAEATIVAANKHVTNGGQAYVMFRNMPVFGKNGQKMYDDARAAGVQFLRYDEKTPLLQAGEDDIVVTMVDSIIPDRAFKIHIDRLVVPSRVKPRLDNPIFSTLLRQPLDAEGFLQPGNIRHMPVSSARRGILFAGGCHNDCNPLESRYESDAITAKVLSLLPEETVTSPVEMVKVDVSKCASCLTCLRLCPHGAIETYLNKKSVTILSNACWECGICAAACPGQAIEHGGLSKLQMSDVLDEATPLLGDKKPLIVFACQQSAIPSLDQAGRLGLTVPTEATFIEVPCAGRVEETAMLGALEKGASQVLVMGCHPSVCRSLKGNLVAAERVKRVQKFLAESGLDTNMVQYHPIANNEPYRLAKIINSAAGVLSSDSPMSEETNEPHVANEGV